MSSITPPGSLSPRSLFHNLCSGWLATKYDRNNQLVPKMQMDKYMHSRLYWYGAASIGMAAASIGMIAASIGMEV